MIPATTRLVSIDLEGQDVLADALEVGVPDNWPPEHYDLPVLIHALQQLADPAERGWSFWYLTMKSPEARQLVGICGFRGRPDSHGIVEIGYSILSQYRGRGLATEAVQGLVEWAFTHSAVQSVQAETLPYLRQSIRVLERCGFVAVGPGSERGVVRYSVDRSRFR
jgi:RimJ/RimL family protein N-acetyltransferase